jgi:hypothetical protein
MPGEGVQDADTSWKVRAAAIRVISAFIRVRSDILKTYYAQLSDTLVGSCHIILSLCTYWSHMCMYMNGWVGITFQGA